jgi:hypothetical protein
MTISKLLAITVLFTGCSLLAQDVVSAQEVVPAQDLVPADTGDAPPAAIVKNGFHIYQVSGSVGYSSVSSILGGGSDFRQLGCDCYGLGSVSTGYSHTGPINRFDTIYTPSYTNYYGLTGSKGFNQSMQVAFESRFSSKWKFTFVATASDSSVVEFALQPATTNSLNGGQDLGSYVNTMMSSISPGQTLLYGGRVFSAGGHTGLTYRPTTRFRVSVEGGFFQSQTRSGSETGGTNGTTNSIAFIIPRNQFENVNVNASYSLTPLTEVGALVSLLNFHTSLGDYRATLVEGSYARKLSRRWSTFAQAGVGTYIPTASAAGLPKVDISGSQFTGSLGFGYQGRESGFFGAYQRMVGDLYGLASSSSQGVQATWNWRQPGRNWSAYISVGYQRLTGGPLGEGTNWQANAALTRALSRKTSMSLSYGYLMNNVGAVTVYNNVNAQVVRLTFLFAPITTQTPGNGAQMGGVLNTP